MKSKIKNIQNSKFTPYNQFVRRYITNVGLRGILILIIIIEQYVWSDNFIMYIYSRGWRQAYHQYVGQ